MRVAIDAMGGDRGPTAVVEGAAAFLAEDSDTELLLVGQEETLVSILKTHGLTDHPRGRPASPRHHGPVQHDPEPNHGCGALGHLG